MLSVILIAATATRPSEVWNQEQTEAAGIVWRGNYTDGTPQPYEYVANEKLMLCTKMCRVCKVANWRAHGILREGKR